MTKKSNFLMPLLILQTLILLLYTTYVGTKEGWIFVQVAANNLSSLTWNGQFTADFSCYLLLSGIWVMWRNKYTIPSIIVALVAMIIGIIVFAPYLLYLFLKEKGNIKRVLVGEY